MVVVAGGGDSVVVMGGGAVGVGWWWWWVVGYGWWWAVGVWGGGCYRGCHVCITAVTPSTGEKQELLKNKNENKYIYRSTSLNRMAPLASEEHMWSP